MFVLKSIDSLYLCWGKDVKGRSNPHVICIPYSNTAIGAQNIMLEQECVCVCECVCVSV